MARGANRSGGGFVTERSHCVEKTDSCDPRHSEYYCTHCIFSVLRSSTSLSLCRLEIRSEISLALGAYLGAYPIFCDYCRFYYLSDFFWVISLISEQ